MAEQPPADAAAFLALPRALATPPGITLGALDAIANGKARSYVVHLGDARFHGFVVRRGHSAVGYVDRCPHVALPLAQTLDEYLSPDGNYIICNWHGAVFEITDGKCIGGPCLGRSLLNWPVRVVDNVLITDG